MIIRELSDIVGSERDIDADGWNSRRLLLAEDGMGFSMHDTIIKPGAALPLCYLNHLEAVYCVEGTGSIWDEAADVEHPIGPGTLYALDCHDRHVLKAQTRMRMICVFNPALTGREVHDEDGSYPASPDA